MKNTFEEHEIQVNDVKSLRLQVSLVAGNGNFARVNKRVLEFP